MYPYHLKVCQSNDLLFSEVGYKESFLDFGNRFIFHGRSHYTDVTNDIELFIGCDNKGHNSLPAVVALQLNRDLCTCESKGEN